MDISENNVAIIPITKKCFMTLHKYDPQLVELYRTIPGRRYEENLKANIIPAEYYLEVKEEAERMGKKTFFCEPFPIIIKIDRPIQININPYIFNNPRINRLAYLERPRDGYQIAKILRGEGANVEIIDDSEEIEINIPRQPKLYPFQEEALQFLRERDYTGLLALEMGLGKTIISCTAIKELGKGPVLIIAPASLLVQWKNEMERLFGYDKATIVTSGDKDAEKKFMQGEVIITNYEFLRKYNPPRCFELLILDECQRIKNWKTKTARAISEVIAKRVIALSGTPLENNLIELYNIVDQVEPAYFGTFKSFLRKYVHGWTGDRNVIPTSLEHLHEVLQGIMFRRRRYEVADQLPKVKEIDYYINLTSQEQSEYERMIYRSDGNYLKLVVDLKVFASNSALRMDISKSSKEVELEWLLDNYYDDKVVVFTQYKKNIPRLTGLVHERVYYVMDGSTEKEERFKIIREFLQSDNAVLFTTEVGNFGLNLQEVPVIINFDIPWTYSRLEQRIGRVNRLGSDLDLNIVVNMLCKNTIDETIYKVVYRKKELADLTIDGVKGWLADHIREVVGR